MHESLALNSDNNGTGDRASNGLRDGYDSGWDLDVTTELRVAREAKGWLHHDDAVNLKDHHGNGPSWDDVANDEFGKDVEGQSLVGNHEWDSNGEDEGASSCRRPRL